MKLTVTLQSDEINRLQFPIVVEMWERVKGSGIKRKEYMKTFTQEERKTIYRYYRKFYDWYLRTGTPEEVSMNVETLLLIKRAIAFFATI